MRADVVIVGAGFAGAATAYHLSQMYEGSIVVIEREKVPGFYASGRNASLILQSVADPQLRAAAAVSREFFHRRRRAVGFQSVGSLLLGDRERTAAVREPERIESLYLSPAEARSKHPALVGHDFERALHTPSDGVIDIAALLQFYLRGARDRGVRILYECALRTLTPDKGFQLQTTQGEIEAGVLVNAAGAWATEIGRLANAEVPPLTAWKRHLFVLDGVPDLPTDSPFIWNLDHAFYFRPESGGVLFSYCDEIAAKTLEPTVEPEAETRLAETISSHLPAFAAATVRRCWSCFRTRTPDSSLMVEWDPAVENLMWVAGLGGHGVGTSWAVGKRAAETIARAL